VARPLGLPHDVAAHGGVRCAQMPQSSAKQAQQAYVDPRGL